MADRYDNRLPTLQGTILDAPTQAEIAEFLDRGWRDLGINLPQQEFTETEKAVHRAVSVLRSSN